MMKKIFGCFVLILMGAVSFSQNPSPEQEAKKMKEIRESLRFVRLAESRKRLGFSDEKLMEVNQLLDQMEGQKIDLIAREHRLRRNLGAPSLTDVEAESLFDELLAVKKEIMENETRLWTGIRGMLTPRESVEFFLFYDRFTKEVQRRMRGKRNQANGGPRGRRQN